MHRSSETTALIERFCTREDLRTSDPYDVWKTPVGFLAKDFFNHHRLAGLIPAAALTLFDTYANNRLRLFYRRQEYPIVRAWATLALLNGYEQTQTAALLDHARRHLDWLREHASTGYRGIGWGLGFRQAIRPGLVYPAGLPLATMTPYALEAFVRYTTLTGDGQFLPVIHGIERFFREDLVVLEETPGVLVTSYGPLADRKVVNAVSYHLYALAELLPYLESANLDLAGQGSARQRMARLYRYLVVSQREDGSWLYSPDGPPFIDCFHSCIVLKNLVRAARRVELADSDAVIARGYEYVKRAFRAPGELLFRRFALENKPSLVRHDLYDNAEMLGLAALLGDLQLAEELAEAINEAFVDGAVIHSQIDRFGLRHNRDMLRWAVMPYIHALTLLDALRSAQRG